MSYQSDAIVLEYLGRVATVAQHRLPPGARSRLVEQLRSQINSERERGPDGPQAVRRILSRLGSPEAVVGREVRRGGLTDEGPDGGEPVWRTGTTRHATVAKQVGFRADATPIRVGEAIPAPSAPSEAGPLWARPRTETAVLPDEPDEDDDGLVGAPAYPIGLAPATEKDDADDADDTPSPTPRAAALRGLGSHALLRELFALVLLAGGAAIQSAVLVILGLVMASTCLAWTQKDKSVASYTIPALVVLGFLVGVWAHAHGYLGDDVDGATAGRRFFDLVPVMFQVAGGLSGAWLLVALIRRQRG